MVKNMIYSAAHISQLCLIIWWRLANCGFILLHSLKFELVLICDVCFLFTTILNSLKKKSYYLQVDSEFKSNLGV